MKITRLYVDGFGKFNHEVFDLTGMNQLIFGENESGKSTLYQFIRTMLFGFPKKRELIRDFTPVNGATYGGKLTFIDPVHGEVTVERYKEKNKGQAQVLLSDGQVGGDSLLASILAPLNQDVFDHVFSFQQENLLDLTELNETRLQRVLLAVGLTGSERLTKMTADFLKERQALFKPSGRIPMLNQQLKEFNRLEQSIKLVEEQENTYKSKWDRKRHLSNLIEKEKKEKKSLESLEKTLLDQQKYFPLYLEYQSYQREKGNDLEASDVTLRSVRDTLQEYRYLTKKETELLEKQGGILDQLSPAVQFYIDNQDLFDSVLEDQLSVESISERRDVLSTQLAAYQSNKEELFEKYHLSSALLDISISSEEESSMKDLAEAEEDLIREKVILSNEKSRLSIKQSKIDKELTETELALSEPMDEVREIPEQNPLIDPFSLKMFSGLALAFAVLSLLLGIAYGNILLFILTLALGGGGVYGFLIASRPQIVSQPKVTPSDVKQQYALQLSESDELAETMQELERDELAYHEKNKLVQQQKEQWATAYGFSMKETIAMWLTKLPVFSQLRDIQVNEEEMSRNVADIDRILASYTESLSFAKQWVPVRNKTARDSFQAVKEFVIKQKEIVSKLESSDTTYIQSELQTVRDQKKSTQKLLNELTEAPASTPVDESTRWLQQQDNHVQNSQRISELENQLQDYFDLTKHYQLLSINRELMKLKQAQENNYELISSYQTEWQTIDYDMKQMEKNGSLDDLHQQRAVKLAVIEGMTEQWLSVRIAEELTQDVFRFLSDQQLPSLLTIVGDYFKLLTNNKYNQVIIKEGQLVVRDSQNRLWQTTQLSSGAKDQLYIAFRLGYIHLHNDEYHSPIIIDDGWLNFDEKRKDTLFHLLNVLSEKNQVICMTSDKMMNDFFKEKNQSVLVIGGEARR